MKKKTQVITTSRVVPIPADKVWSVLAEDYGAIAHSHPSIVKSEYVNGTLQGAAGAERLCYFNEKGSQMFHEKIVKWEPEKMMFSQVIVNQEKFPMDKDNTLATYTVEKIDENSSKINGKVEYRTKPALMGALVKGKFKSMLDNYFLAIEHHLKTGESVTAENFKKIKKQYKYN